MLDTLVQRFGGSWEDAEQAAEFAADEDWRWIVHRRWQRHHRYRWHSRTHFPVADIGASPSPMYSTFGTRLENIYRPHPLIMVRLGRQLKIASFER
jgi:hypothetical protein